MIGNDLMALKAWVEENACKGKSMKAPSEDALEIAYKEPTCYLMRLPSLPGQKQEDAEPEVAPCVVIILKKGGSKNRVSGPEAETAEGRRAKVEVQFLFLTYDPGHRSAESQTGKAYAKIANDDEEAACVALNWAEDTMNKLVEAGSIPGTGWAIEKDDWEYGPLADDSGFLADRWPYIYTVLSGSFTSSNPELKLNKGDPLGSILD